MPSLVEQLRGMARNNAWSNHRLYGACVALTATELTATRTSFFPSILLTLNHILIVDWYYLGSLTYGGRGPSAYADDLPYPVFDDLRTAQTDSDRALIAFCDSLDQTVVLARDDGRRSRETVAAVLSHLFVHQVHHRGQVHAMLAGTAAAPPQLDEFFLEEDASRRAEDLAALGWA